MIYLIILITIYLLIGIFLGIDCIKCIGSELKSIWKKILVYTLILLFWLLLFIWIFIFHGGLRAFKDTSFMDFFGDGSVFIRNIMDKIDGGL